MKFVLKPSLKQMALVKIGILLWNQNDVGALISKLSYGDLHPFCKWKEIEEKVKDKVSQLFIPQLLKEKVFGVIRPIGLEHLKWMQYYHQYEQWIELECYQDLDFPALLPTELCWTSQGTVDRKRTAEVLVADENLNVTRRYILACDYFLEDHIIRFWNRLPEDFKNYDWHNFPVISFWSDNMKRRVVDDISYEDEFHSSVLVGNKVAAKYFLQKLTPQEREESLEELTEYIYYADVLCFLLPELTEEERKNVFENSPHRVLQYFLQWPWQSFFMGVANRMWDFLSKDNYREILGSIIIEAKEGDKEGYNYQRLFREFWEESPSALKDLFLEDNMTWLLCSLFDSKDKENIRLILKDATLTAKTRLIYSAGIDYRLKRSIQENEWNFLEFFIREFFPSKNEMLKFKEEYEMCLMHSYFKKHLETKKLEWGQMFYESDVSFCKYNKRSLEEKESSSSKRFPSTVTHA